MKKIIIASLFSLIWLSSTSINAQEATSLNCKDCVGSRQLKPDSVGSVHLKNDSVGSAHLKNDSVGSPHLKNDSVGSAHLKDDSVGSAHLKPESVGSAHLKNGAVKENKIADGAITESKIAPGVIIEGPPGISCWDLNSNTLCDTNEDVDGSGDCTVTDCQGLQKPDYIKVPDDYPTIQEAINAGAEDVTIEVAAGTYSESLEFYNKNVRLFGAGSSSTIINGGGQTTLAFFDSSRLYVNGVTIRGGGHGIYGKGNCHLNIENSIIESNSRDGVRIRLNSSAKLYNVEIKMNGENGLYVSYSSSAEAYQSIFSDNNQNGIQVLGSSSVALDGNEIFDNWTNGLGVTGASQASLWSGNNIYNNNSSGTEWSGIGIYHNSTVGIGSGNEIYGNNGSGIIALMKSHFWLNGVVRDNLDHGIDLGFDSSAFLGGSTVTGNGGFGVYCETESKTIDMPTDSTGNTLGSDNGLCGIREPWREPVLLGTWYHYTGGQWNPPGYFKDNQGIVHLKGLVWHGAEPYNSLIFVLEEGYRPQYTSILAPASAGFNTNYGHLYVYPNGEVHAVGGGHSGTWVSLDGLFIFTPE